MRLSDEDPDLGAHRASLLFSGDSWIRVLVCHPVTDTTDRDYSIPSPLGIESFPVCLGRQFTTEDTVKSSPTFSASTAESRASDPTMS